MPMLADEALQRSFAPDSPDHRGRVNRMNTLSSRRVVTMLPCLCLTIDSFVCILGVLRTRFVSCAVNKRARTTLFSFIVLHSTGQVHPFHLISSNPIKSGRCKFPVRIDYVCSNIMRSSMIGVLERQVYQTG